MNSSNQVDNGLLNCQFFVLVSGFRQSSLYHSLLTKFATHSFMAILVYVDQGLPKGKATQAGALRLKTLGEKFFRFSY